MIRNLESFEVLGLVRVQESPMVVLESKPGISTTTTGFVSNNELFEAEDAAPLTTLVGGAIKIHKK